MRLYRRDRYVGKNVEGTYPCSFSILSRNSIQFRKPRKTAINPMKVGTMTSIRNVYVRV